MRQRDLHVTPTEIEAFRQAEVITHDVRELKHLQAVRLYGTGEAVTTIQRLTGCGPESPAQWARLYRRSGLAALQPSWHGEIVTNSPRRNEHR